MSDEAKKQAVTRILDAWKRVPDLRLGQLIMDATNGRDIFYVTDKWLVEEIEEFVKEYKQ